MMGRKSSADVASGQALVEFALVVPMLVLLIAATVDMGRGIYLYNGVSEAVREIARADSLHACDSKPCSIGTSSSTAAAISNQRGMVPGMGTPTFSCVAIDGSAISSTCAAGDLVKVTASVSFAPIMGLIGTWSLQSSSTVEIP
jgi:TadE-like protein